MEESVQTKLESELNSIKYKIKDNVLDVVSGSLLTAFFSVNAAFSDNSVKALVGFSLASAICASCTIFSTVRLIKNLKEKKNILKSITGERKLEEAKNNLNEEQTF